MAVADSPNQRPTALCGGADPNRAVADCTHTYVKKMYAPAQLPVPKACPFFGTNFPNFENCL